MRVDHVLLAVDDLHDAAVALHDRYGLASAEGGRHPRWGTANRIVPIGDAYLELVAVVDPATASGSAFGRWVANARPAFVQPLGWAVSGMVIDDVARRLDLEIESGARAAPDGSVLQWRLAGVERAAADPSLPFFIEWGAGTPHPSRLAVTHSMGAVELRRLELRGDSDRLAAWIGDHDLPVVVEQGPSSVLQIVLTAGGREIVLGPLAP